jgi:hypothetical protein
MTITQIPVGLAGQRLDRIASFEAGTADAGTSNIYAGDGRLFRRPAAASPNYQRGLVEAMRLYERVLSGNRRAALDFQESLTRSDFTFLFADIIDRQMLAAYATQPVRWDMVAKRGRVRDFRTVKRFTLDGGKAVLSKVKELAPYTARAVTDGGYSYSVDKYGAEIDISWETLINDDLDAFAELPQALALAARRTEEYFATDLFVASTGPDATFFSSGNANIITANPALSVSGLQTAFTVLAAQKDSDNGPIYVNGVTLVVPPALEVVANNIINATEIIAASGGGDGTGNDSLRVANWMQNKVKVVVNPWLPIIDTTSGNAAWYLIANPNEGRPAMEVGFLTGHETPDLWMKAPDAIRVGGGLVGPEEGDFQNDGIRYRVRHVLGGTLMDPKSAVASTGAGS